ncbi:MAG: type I-E CRISPR-associated protein Cas7/Cse4/CasC, partial [Myxococcales bacterium]|nr:type I-E CRISPR-associated protein Cas7/Cse4/CasC [Myxococcales bacterium]
KFVQIHYLTSYPAGLLNRDDVGFAKRIVFGGKTRTRISSQCQKRHWRRFEGEHALSGIGLDMSVRSRLTFDRQIKQPLIEEGVSEELATAAVTAMMKIVLGESPKAKKKAKDEASKSEDGDGEDSKKDSLQTSQITVLGPAEVEYLRSQCRVLLEGAKTAKELESRVKGWNKKDMKKNLEALRCAAGLDAALFGRMVTSDVLARGDAALHVAHAFTVHEEMVESDYFSAVDDLLADDDELGSGHIGNTELTTGLFYGYIVVDVPLLISNLEGCEPKDVGSADREATAEVLRRLVHLVATVSPGAKLGSTAPHAYAQTVMVETGDAQPRTLANAFLRPVRPGDDLRLATCDALGRHVSEMDAMYSRSTTRRIAGLGDVSSLAETVGATAGSLPEMAGWLAEQVLS